MIEFCKKNNLIPTEVPSISQSSTSSNLLSAYYLFPTSETAENNLFWQQVIFPAVFSAINLREIINNKSIINQFKKFQS